MTLFSSAERHVNAEKVRPAAELAHVELDVRVHAYSDAAHAHNTKRAYRSDWAAFETWC